MKKQEIDTTIYTRDDLNYLACLIDRGSFLNATIDTRIAAHSGIKMMLSVLNKSFCEFLQSVFGGTITPNKVKNASKETSNYTFLYQMRNETIKNVLPQVLPYLRLEASRRIVLLCIEFLDIPKHRKNSTENSVAMQKKFDLAMQIREVIQKNFKKNMGIIHE